MLLLSCEIKSAICHDTLVHVHVATATVTVDDVHTHQRTQAATNNRVQTTALTEAHRTQMRVPTPIQSYAGITKNTVTTHEIAVSRAVDSVASIPAQIKTHELHERRAMRAKHRPP